MHLIEMLVPRDSDMVPGAYVLSAYLVWNDDEETTGYRMGKVQDALRGDGIIDVDHFLYAFQEIVKDPVSGGHGLSQVRIVGLKLTNMATGPYAINLKSLRVFGVCKGEMEKTLEAKIKEYATIQNQEIEMMNCRIIPVKGALASQINHNMKK